MRTLALFGLLFMLAGATAPAIAQTSQLPIATESGTVEPTEPTFRIEFNSLIALPLATLLGASLALRPRRRGTPPRSAPVIQTQIILSIIGALVMIVVGSSLARAFGVVGAAGLVRYRAKIDDPKDAGVMLTTLAAGLACGVGAYGMAIYATLFLIAVLWVIESFEPTARKAFVLEIKTKNAVKLQARIEALFRRRRVKFELRESSPEEISYFVQMPMDLKTDVVSSGIIALDPDPNTGVEWKAEKKKA